MRRRRLLSYPKSLIRTELSKQTGVGLGAILLIIRSKLLYVQVPFSTAEYGLVPRTAVAEAVQ